MVLPTAGVDLEVVEEEMNDASKIGVFMGFLMLILCAVGLLACFIKV